MTPQNVQARWTLAEETQLAIEFQDGLTLLAMCEAHLRTPNAIVTRLVKLGCLAEVGKAYYPIDPDPFMSFAQIKEAQQRWLAQHGEPT